MEQDKISKFIKLIRKNYNLTQKELAEKYGVTYQAVSKWENGINMPDTLLIKQMSKDFKVSLDDIFEGQYSKNNQLKKTAYIFILLLTVFFIFLFAKGNEDFEFKTISSECNNFNISGSISYNKNKSAIFINEIKYCGGEDKEEYQKIKCTLFESNNDIDRKISNYDYEKNKTILLEEFLQDVNFTIDNYPRICREYKKNSLYLIIEATNKENIITTYKIPLSLKTK